MQKKIKEFNKILSICILNIKNKTFGDPDEENRGKSSMVFSKHIPYYPTWNRFSIIGDLPNKTRSQ